MSTRVMAAVWPLQMPPTPKAVLVSLADNANDAGHCWPSMPTICERTCLGKTAVIAAVKWLESNKAIQVDRGASKSNRYTVTPHLYEGDQSGDFHYVYCITHIPTGSFYVGLRSSYSDPARDDYWGSGKACEWLSSVRHECRRDVLATFATRQAAAEHETSVLTQCVGDARCLNRRVSSPGQALGNAPALFDGARGEPSASRTVRSADRSAGGRGGSASRTPTVREADPNRKEPSGTVKKASGLEAIDFSSWPSPPSPQVLADFLAHRKAKRAPITPTVIENFGRELHKAAAHGISVDTALAECITRNWQGLKADWLLRDLAPQTRAGPASAPMGKQMQGLMALEEMKRGLVRNRNSDGSAEAGVLLLGPDAGR